MQLIIIVILGALLGFLYGSYTDGFIFSSDICLFAGITLIMPSLFKFEFGHIKLVWKHKLLLFKGFGINYVLFPIFAVIIGMMTHNFGITAGLFLIAVFSGGGMVMHWVKKTQGDTSLGFLLLFINLLFISFSLLLLHIFGTYSAGFFDETYDSSISIDRFASAVIKLLIVIPFLLSRVVILITPLMNAIETYRPYISHISIFIIIFYLFGLQSSQMLVDVYDLEPELFPISFLAVAAFYFLTFVASRVIFDIHSPQGRAAFWHSITRYLTLALVISTFTVNTFGVSMLIPIMFAYLIQIPLSVFISKRYMHEAPQSS